MQNETIHQRAEKVREFNRFYTRQIGLLEEGLLSSPYSLTEARVIFEIAQHERVTATTLAGDLKLDPGYLSRILQKFTRLGLIEKTPSQSDGRQSDLSLNAEGQAAFGQLNSRSQAQIEAMLAGLDAPSQERLVAAMTTIMRLAGAGPEQKVPYILRPPQPGDLGWVVQRHGALYSQEYKWNEEFEGLVAEIVAHYIQNYDPQRERCWIAEREGENAGSVFLVKQSETVAKLRLLLVEPSARGLGIGSRLVAECIQFARQAGYQKITLWTNSVLVAARHIYAVAGFRMVADEAYHGYGHDLVSETWEMDL